MTGALVIGKFYPPHLGHIGLIERATVEADQVTIVVMAAIAETIPLADRIAWLRETFSHLPAVRVIGVHDDAPVDYDGEAAWVAHIAQLEAALRQHGVRIPEVVVSSEPYGDELARRLGARSVVFDAARHTVPISGSAIRNDLTRTWHFLPEATRRGLATRVIVVGAESTGTSTLADDLVAHFRAGRYPGILPVPEYGREFTYVLHERSAVLASETGKPTPSPDDLVWMPEHFAEIAREQTAREQAAALASPLVIADTDALATTVWERRYLGADSRRSVDAASPASLPRRHLYLVTDHVDVPFEQDGWRDGEQVRPAMTGWFVDELQSRGFSWILMRGDRATRLAYAIEAINGILAERERFGEAPWGRAVAR